MGLSSDDESSESSGNEYLVTPGKLDLDSSFFQQKPSSSKAPTSSSKYAESSDDDSDDDFLPNNDRALDSNALLAEVMRNLEKVNRPSNDEKKPETFSPIPTTNEKSPSRKGKNVLSEEITNLLLQGESGVSSSALEVDERDEDEAEEKSSDYAIPKEGVNITLPGMAMMMFGRQKKRGHDFEDELRKKKNRRLRANQINVHKVGLLCWLAHGFHLNVAINDIEILSTAMSLMPSGGYPKGRVDLKYLEQFTKWFKNLFQLEFRETDNVVGRESLLTRLRERKVHDYKEMVLLYAATLRAIGLNCRIVVSLCPPPLKPSQDQLFQSSAKTKEETKTEKKTRGTVKGKKKAEGKGKKTVKGEKGKKSSDESPSKIVAENSEVTRREAKTEARKRAAEVLAKFANNKRKKSIKGSVEEEKVVASSKCRREEVKSPPKLRTLRSRTIGKSSETEEKSKKIEKAKIVTETSLGKRTRGTRIDKAVIASTSTMRDCDSEDEFEAKSPVKKKKNYAKDNDNAERDSCDSKNELKSEMAKNKKINVKSTINVAPKITKNTAATDEYSDEESESRLSVKKNKTNAESIDMSSENDSESDEAYEPQGKKKKITPSKNTKKNVGKDDEFEPKPPAKTKKVSVVKEESKAEFKGRDSIDRRVLSSDEEPAELLDAKSAQNIWVEVYVEAEESWISVSVVDNKIHCVSEIYKKAPKPVLYVIAWNSVGSLKDVTRRYCPHWLTVTRKQRIDESWWVETLSPWMEKSTAMSRAEDEMLLQRELEQPLPKTVGECKGHPLYALARHLLKFEALYPPESVPLGHLRTGEAIYSRHCVHTLYSRETWLKKARVVKPAQDAYKIVKSMPKYDKLSGMRLPDLPLELFGKWQTTQYVPPVAKDGVVPRNEYGNVNLFKQCMLPIGTVHINLPALNRVARKLNIDCVPAVVGFNFGARGAVPAIEGYVVCEEFEGTLREAWQEDQIESEKRAVEKRENRIYGNWKKLIKGLFIRERLAVRYDFNDGGDDEDTKPSASTKRASKKTVESKKINGKKSNKS